jgi:hypothetical protein
VRAIVYTQFNNTIHKHQPRFIVRWQLVNVAPHTHTHAHTQDRLTSLRDFGRADAPTRNTLGVMYTDATTSTNVTRLDASPRGTVDWTLDEIKSEIIDRDDEWSRHARLAFVLDAPDLDRTLALVVHTHGQWIAAFDPRGSGRVSVVVAQLAGWLGRRFAWRGVPFRTLYRNDARVGVGAGAAADHSSSSSWLAMLARGDGGAALLRLDDQPWFREQPDPRVRISRNQQITLGTWWSGTGAALQRESTLAPRLGRMRANIDNWRRRNAEQAPMPR